MPFKKGQSGSPENQFSSTNQPKKNGRKPKIYNILKEKGYSKDDIATCFSELGFYTIQEAQEVCLDETKPIIMQIIAKCFIKAYEDGDWSKCKDIIDQTLGKATQKHEVNGQVETETNKADLSKLTDDELRQYIELATKCRPNQSGTSEA